MLAKNYPIEHLAIVGRSTVVIIDILVEARYSVLRDGSPITLICSLGISRTQKITHRLTSYLVALYPRVRGRLVSIVCQYITLPTIAPRFRCLLPPYILINVGYRNSLDDCSACCRHIDVTASVLGLHNLQDVYHHLAPDGEVG